ncbi:MAG: DNA cytosine methyltransferase, partial [Planctomycetota bacterium]|nr:DNA cytosine methyltransferase [Planctomycetota bacterium]
FAGIGLVHDALKKTGWRCIYANDIDPKKREMYEKHFGSSSHYHECDVWDTDAVLERINETPFLATASFPCTDMSLAGHMRGFKGTQSSAYFGFVHAIEALGARKPKMLLLENVTGFLHSRRGKDFASAVGKLADLGYWLDSFVVDAKYFVPQSRQRLFIVGYHHSIARGPILRNNQKRLFDDVWHPAISRSAAIRPSNLRDIMNGLNLATGWATIDSGQPIQRRYSLLDFLENHKGLEWWTRANVSRHLSMLSDLHREKLKSVKTQDCNRQVFTAFRRVRAGELRTEIRFDGIAGCLRTPRGGSAKQIVVQVQDGKVDMRWMTPREYANLQGAPDFNLPANTIQGLFGFGDGICVPVVEWIDEHMLTPAFCAAKTHKPPSRNARSILTR